MRGASRRRLSVILALAATVGFAGLAAAQECPATCGLEKRACVQDARADKLACKLDCRTSGNRAGLGACMRLCVRTFRSDAYGCGTDHGSCMIGCGPGSPPVPGMCRMMCGHDFVACTQGVLVAARSCIRDCPGGRLGLVCIGICAVRARHDAAACADTFQSCAAGCGGSPSGAFLDGGR